MENLLNTDIDLFMQKEQIDSDTEAHGNKNQYCDLCRVFFQEKYSRNHLYSKIHRSKLKENDKTDFKSNLYCSPCDEIFSDVAFFEAHKGTKTHKRNLKAHPDPPSDILTLGVFSPRAMKIRDPEVENIFTREKYKTRPNSEQGTYRQQYITNLCTYLSLRLSLVESVRDFSISTNDRRWQSFGDIVICVTTYKDKEKSAVYAIKCKQVCEVGKQIDSLTQAKINMEKEYVSLAGLKKLQEFDIVKFLIFTTNSTSSKFSSVESENTVEVSGETLNLWKTDEGTVPESDIILVKSSKRTDIIDVTSDRDNVFLIYPKDENDSYQLPFVYLYTSQNVSPKMITDLFQKKFDVFIYHQYLKYIENWSEGKLGGNYYLTKRDVILKIGEILLSSYLLLPKKILFGSGNFDTWNEIISQVDVTIVKRENHVTSKIRQPINQIIETSLGKIDDVSKSIEITKDILEAVKEPIIRAYLFEEYDTQESEIPMSKIYLIFWKAGKIPLLLETEKKDEREIILKVIRFMKENGVIRKFILKTSQSFVDNSLKIFSCLDDVKHLVDLDEVKLSFIRGELSLKTICSSDSLFLKWITPNIFFDMALGKYEIRKVSNTDEEQPSDLKMILDDINKNNLLMGLYPEYPLSQNELENGSRLKGINPLWF
ncbi:uncharacterized protein [Leptinotarsa decemlineata]|uniref:uncharacterized protein n=1 Tax=Leptinotarsa decemlineata TaxID=7539 RepID=UPI003D304FB3